MKKLLLLAAGALMGLSASAQWAVVGNYCDWSFQSASTFSGEGDVLTCEIDHLNTGFKIVDITNDNWDVQYGTATPIELNKTYVLDAKDGGPDPADMAFADNVLAVNKAFVTWNPSTAEFKVTGEAEEQVVDNSTIYLIGQPNDWGINNDSYPLHSVAEGVYEAVFNIAAGEGIYFRFYTALGNWGGDGALPSIGPLPNDNTNVPVEFTDGVFEGTCEPGKGSWNLTSWDGGEITFLVDMNNWKVVFTVGNAGIEELASDNNAPAVYYNLNGVKVNNPEKGIYLVKKGNKTSKVIVR